MPYSSSLYTVLDSLAQSTVLCIGDVMIDYFIYGAVERISPEAPIPILKVDRQTATLGGAANVARNLASLNSRCHLMGLVGADQAAQELHALLSNESPTHITAHLQQEADRHTAVKNRFIGQKQQLLRTDFESAHALSEASQADLLDQFAALLPQISYIILSDYGKGTLPDGFCQQLIQLANQHNRPVLVDPKGKDYSKYRGADFITPNKQELSLASGLPTETDDQVVAACQKLIQAHDLSGIIATRSAQGISVVLSTGVVDHIPTEALEVYDVSGAGDTVVAVIAAALGAGASLLEAVQLANCAAGIVVAKQGTAVVTPVEMRQALRRRYVSMRHQTKIVTADYFQELRKLWKQNDFKIGFTNGCFDLLHPGHVRILSESRSRCDRLVVGLNSDASVKRLKGDSRPINSQDTRATLLAAMESVDAVIIFDEDTPEQLIHTVVPDVLIKGADYQKHEVVGADFVEAQGGEVALVELVEGQSTSNIIHKINSS